MEPRVSPVPQTAVAFILTLLALGSATTWAAESPKVPMRLDDGDTLPSPGAAEPEKSVISIINFSQTPVWDAPWRFEPVQRATGSGFVIKGQKIMTNAHVISWGRQILVRRLGDPRLYNARVRFVGHDCDLALLEVEDPRFFEGLEPLDFGELPTERSSVVTFGYPAGGEQLSYTRGVVSRIEMQPYSHIGNRSFLAVQTDSAINPGNSGGPVLLDGKVVGVAFQAITQLENTGFFIPTPIIAHFMKDIEDGRYDGFPDLGVFLASMQNTAYRRRVGLPDDSRGARIDGVFPIPEAKAKLRVDDVILRIGPYDVASDQTISYEGHRVHAGVATDLVQNGEHIEMEIWRDGKALTIDLITRVFTDDRREGNQYDVLPRYFVHAGLIFVPLSLDYLKTFGRNWTAVALPELIYELKFRRWEDPEHWRPEPVVLAGVLSHSVNANMLTGGRSLVDRINGIRIERLEDAVRAIDTCTNDQHVIEFMPSSRFDCLDRKAAAAAHGEILKNYSITADRRL